jgi:hypothetical protein
MFLRGQSYQELCADWLKSEMRLLAPPTDLIGAVVRNMRFTRAPAVLLVPEWHRHSWYRPALDISMTVCPLPLPPEEVWAGTHRLNPAWRLLLLEIV